MSPLSVPETISNVPFVGPLSVARRVKRLSRSRLTVQGRLHTRGVCRKWIGRVSYEAVRTHSGDRDLRLGPNQCNRHAQTFRPEAGGGGLVVEKE